MNDIREIYQEFFTRNINYPEMIDSISILRPCMSSLLSCKIKEAVLGDCNYSFFQTSYFIYIYFVKTYRQNCVINLEMYVTIRRVRVNLDVHVIFK